MMIKLLSATALGLIFLSQSPAMAITALERVDVLAVNIENAVKQVCPATPETEDAVKQIHHILRGKTYGINLKNHVTDVERENVNCTLINMHLLKKDMIIPQEIYQNMLMKSNPAYYNHLSALIIMHQAAYLVANFRQYQVDQLVQEISMRLNIWTVDKKDIEQSFKNHLLQVLLNRVFIKGTLGDNYLNFVQQFLPVRTTSASSLKLNRPVSNFAPNPTAVEAAQPTFVPQNAPTSRYAANEIPKNVFTAFIQQDLFMDQEILPLEIRVPIIQALERPYLTWDDLQTIVNDGSYINFLRPQFEEYARTYAQEFVRDNVTLDNDIIEDTYIDQILNGGLLLEHQRLEVRRQHLPHAPLTWGMLSEILKDNALFMVIQQSLSTPQPEMFDQAVMNQHIRNIKRAFTHYTEDSMDDEDDRELQEAITYIERFEHAETESSIPIRIHAQEIRAAYEPRKTQRAQMQSQREQEELDEAIARSLEEEMVAATSPTTTTSTAAAAVEEEPQVDLSSGESSTISELWKAIHKHVKDQAFDPQSGMNLTELKGQLETLNSALTLQNEDLEQPYLSQAQQQAIRQQMNQLEFQISELDKKIKRIEAPLTEQANVNFKLALAKANEFFKLNIEITELEQRLSAASAAGKIRIESDLNRKKRTFASQEKALSQQTKDYILKISKWMGEEKFKAALEMFGLDD